MNTPSPLLYFNARDDARRRRPPAVTVLAILGIVLSSLCLFLQNSPLPPPSTQTYRAYSSPYGAAGTDPTAALAYAFGSALRAGAIVLMLVGCAGLLSLRAAARWIVIVCAYAWIVLAAIAFFVLLYTLGVSQSLSGRAPPASAAPSLFLPVVLMIAQLAFAIAALMILRGSKMAGVFVRAQPQAELPPLFKPAAIFVLVFAGIWSLEALLGFVLRAGNLRNVRSSSVVHLLSYPTSSGDESRALQTADSLLALLLYATYIVGAALILARRSSGVVWITIACLIQLTFNVAFLGRYSVLSVYRAYNVVPSTSQAAYDQVAHIATSLSNLLWLGAILLIFTWRPGPLAGLTTPPSPPPPLPRGSKFPDPARGLQL